MNEFTGKQLIEKLIELGDAIKNLRVKPESKHRPYTQKEFPFPAQVRDKNREDWWTVIDVRNKFIDCEDESFTYDEALEQLEIRESHKEEWRVCGVEIDEEE